MVSRIIHRTIALICMVFLLIQLSSCTTTHDIKVFWSDENGSVLDTKTYEATSDSLFLENIQAELRMVKMEPSRYHSIYSLAKVYIEAFPSGAHINFVEQLMVISGMFSIRYNPYIQKKQYDFQKTYIGLGYIKEIIQLVTNMAGGSTAYINSLGVVLEKGYWHDEALAELVSILEDVLIIDFENKKVVSDPVVEPIRKRVAVFQNKYRKWCEDTRAADLFRDLGVLP